MQFDQLNRRSFITLLGGAAWPLAAHAQQPERMRRIGVLSHLAENDPEGQARHAALVRALTELGWIEGRNIRLDVRWGAGDEERYRRYASELISLAPDLMICSTAPVAAALQRATFTVPIVFVGAIDPVGSGLVNSLARPGGNITGFALFEYAIGAKWLELLKQIAPHVTRAAVLRDPANASGVGQFAAIQAVGSIGMELSVIGLHDAHALEQGLAAFARNENGSNHPDVITGLAARYRLPAVYPFRYFVAAGGLLSYGPDIIGEYRPAMSYVDRILKGEKPADLPVQAPTTYELLINLKTAKALGLTVPPMLLARADEVIE
jgi:putative ABC transport system substrate-binding protein